MTVSDNCVAYQCYESQMNCGPDGYLINYGYKYCNRFESDRYRLLFTTEGKDWIICVRECLIRFLENYFNNLNKNDITSKVCR